MNKVLILGRPNVGKSTLINALLKERRAIIDDLPGVTRDIIGYPIRTPRGSIELLDSGGVLLDRKSVKDSIQKGINERVIREIKTVDWIVFLVDGTTGEHPDDMDIAKMLRAYSDKVMLVANKVETMVSHHQIHEFLQYGFGEPLCISAKQRIGLKMMIEALANVCPFDQKKIPTDSSKLAIVGRPNVGKSSLVNAFLNEEKVLVDDQAGTTRDAIHCLIQFQNQPITLVDTAGLRRKPRVKAGVEQYSTLRTTHSIESADVVIVMLDATDFLRDQDRKIINLVIRKQKKMVVFVNKWDGMERTDEQRNMLVEGLCSTIPNVIRYPIVVGSVHLKHRVVKLLETTLSVYQASKQRIPTADLNQFVENMIRQFPPVSKSGELIKLYYAAQVDVDPPTFVFFVNNPKLISTNYERHLEKKMRYYYRWLEGMTIQLKFRHHRGERK